jgi:hypothetical protein
VANTDERLAILIVYLHPILVAWFGHMRGTYALNRFRLFCCALILIGLALALSVSLARLDAMGVALALVGAGGAAGLLVANGEAVGEGGTIIVNFHTAIVALLPACAIGIVMCLGLALFFAGRYRPLDWCVPR